MKDFSTDVEKCLETLKQGGVILYPTDTVWGLGCDATSQDAVEKIYALKRRPADKSMIILLADERDILKYVTELDLDVFAYLKNVQKPTTVIYKSAIGVAESIVGSDGTIGIRVTKELFSKHLVKRFRKPVVSTSANLSGEPTPGSFSEISPVIIQGADYVVQYRQDENISTEPSALVKWNQDGTVTVVRQ